MTQMAEITSRAVWVDEIAERPTMRQIAERVARHYGLTLEQFKGPQQCAAIAFPRQEAMAEMYATGLWSNQQIGNYFGGRDHTTVTHARQRVVARAAENGGRL